jgi:hypothetical protein
MTVANKVSAINQGEPRHWRSTSAFAHLSADHDPGPDHLLQSSRNSAEKTRRKNVNVAADGTSGKQDSLLSSKRKGNVAGKRRDEHCLTQRLTRGLLSDLLSLILHYGGKRP